MAIARAHGGAHLDAQRRGEKRLPGVDGHRALRAQGDRHHARAAGDQFARRVAHMPARLRACGR